MNSNFVKICYLLAALSAANELLVSDVPELGDDRMPQISNFNSADLQNAKNLAKSKKTLTSDEKKYNKKADSILNSMDSLAKKMKGAKTDAIAAKYQLQMTEKITEEPEMIEENVGEKINVSNMISRSRQGLTERTTAAPVVSIDAKDAVKADDEREMQ